MEAALSRSGGVYLPPHKVARLVAENEGDDTVQQRLKWEQLRKTINGCVNKANTSNIPEVARELFKVNLIRGRGLVARAILRAQQTSPSFTAVFTCLLAVVNTRIPEIGTLLINRLVYLFRRAYRRNDKVVTIACLKFFAHLVNQKVLADVTALEIAALLLEHPTNDSVHVCCGFLEEVGAYMEEEMPKGMQFVCDRLRSILNEGEVEQHTQYIIEKFFALRRNKYDNFPACLPELDLLDEDEQDPHTVDLLDENLDRGDMLDIFKFTPPDQYAAEEEKWHEISEEIIGKDDEENEDDLFEELEAAEASAAEGQAQEDLKIIDRTEQERVNLRKTIYLCVVSSANFEECVHKLLKLNTKPGDEKEIATMLIDCCSMERTFNRFYALQAERLSNIDKIYSDQFAECFQNHFKVIHRYETNNLRNTAKFFAHLLSREAIPWDVFSCVRLTEEATTAASRIFLKILFQSMVDEIGFQEVMSFIKAHSSLMAETVLPEDNTTNMRFAVNFFTAIGLASIGEELRGKLLGMKAKELKDE